MFSSLELLAYGAAVVTDTVLMMTLLNARNYARVMLPLVIFSISVWVFHLATFCHAYFEGLATNWDTGIHLMSMVAMVVGLAMMPSALLHLLWRLRTSGFALNTKPDSRIVLLYWPLLVTPIVARSFGEDPQARFLDLCRPFAAPYLIWAGLVIGATVVVCFRVARQEKEPAQSLFYRLLGYSMLAMAALLYVTIPVALAWPEGLPLLQLLAVLAPMAPVGLFTYFVVRFNFLRLFVERTLIYAAGGVIVLLAYELALNGVHAQIKRQWGINAEILQGALFVALVMLMPPLRRRVLEALRYLISGQRMASFRAGIRRLAVRITERAGETPVALCEGFVKELREAAGLSYVSAWLADGEGRLKPFAPAHSALSAEHVDRLYKDLHSEPHTMCTWRDAPSAAALDALQHCDASAAIGFAARRVRGLLLLGRRSHNRDFGEEESNILVVLVEQLAVAMENCQLQQDRLAAERQAQQNERLRSLGLLASAMAHEVRNPLSAIKTIAAVVAEDLGAESPHSDDLHLIVSETNRLSQTTSDLLAFARPAPEGGPSGSFTATLISTLAVLRHHARQHEISLDAEIPAGLPGVRIGGSALQEIFFNLLNNSIEATGRGGRVTVTCSQSNGHVIAEVCDNGAGIEPAIQNQLFQPFITTKDSGGGMGLYIVGCRVREAGGVIECRSRANQGTTFILRLPIAEP
ncbi:MAG TPA: ATP-binding protein [Pirellulales bacterium]|jgi:signal transduction histidine kinase